MEQEPKYGNLEDGDPCLRRATNRPDRGISCRQHRSPKLLNSRSRFYRHNRIFLLDVLARDGLSERFVTTFCSCVGSSGPLSMLPRSVALTAVLLGHLLDRASFWNPLCVRCTRVFVPVQLLFFDRRRASVRRGQERYWREGASHHNRYICPRLFPGKRAGLRERVVLPVTQTEWRCRSNARWRTTGGLTPCQEIILAWTMWTMK